ncbi:hypothetical protein KAONASHI_00140 [Serratia phage vB_SmaP-Kaonashi]|nr:hypothetical protein KAONASHI_00140 [Serratia phage vB_SmaP-Kaonashi]
MINKLASLVLAAAWLTALVMDIRAHKVWMSLADFFIAPVGVVRGVMMWFGAL